MCCGYGKVQLPELKDAPTNYQNLFHAVDSKGKNFMKNIRGFNSMFSFTSMGGKVDSSINRGNAPYVFRLSGQNYHITGSLLPEDGAKPKFSQLYIYDTENEVSNRQKVFWYIFLYLAFINYFFILLIYFLHIKVVYIFSSVKTAKDLHLLIHLILTSYDF